MKTFTLFTITLLLLCGCHGKQPQKQERPTWINNPHQSGTTGAVGSAKIHFEGSAAQRKLAISRALDELAQQQGVVVTSQILRQDSREGELTSSKADIYSFQKNSGETVHAYIEAVWQDPETEELFIWMIKE